MSLSLILTLSIFFVPTANSQSDKVLVCHRTKGLQNHWVAISVSSNSLSSHLDHGDFSYIGPTDDEGNLPKDTADNWCLSSDPSVLPPPPVLLAITSSCQADATNTLIRVENSTEDYLSFNINSDLNSPSTIIGSLPPAQDGQPSFVYYAVPVNHTYFIETFLLNTETSEQTSLEISSVYIPQSPICTFQTYCFDNTTYSLFDPYAGVVSYPPEGSTDGACTQ